MSQDFRIHWIEGVRDIVPDNDNVDVVVTLADGSRFIATFFTLRNVETLLDSYRRTGECAGGTYIWASNMILVRELNLDVVRRTVADLLETGEFSSAFDGPITD